jgi:hypothetical protein
MKKFSLMILFFVVAMTACNTSSNDSHGEENDDAIDENIGQETPGGEENESGEDAPKEDHPSARENTDEAEYTKEDDVTDNMVVYPKADDPAFQDVVNMAYDIFIAQKKEDYEYLESILAEGATLDKDINTFSFENISYPHEQEFVQTEPDHIEFRYTHEEEDGTVIVGFGVIDYETESSFTIDFQFVSENGEWKMKDMDKNA